MRTYDLTVQLEGEEFNIDQRRICLPVCKRAAAIFIFRQAFGKEPMESFHYRNWAMAADTSGNSISLDQVNWVPQFPLDQFLDEQGLYYPPSRQICFPAQHSALRILRSALRTIVAACKRLGSLSGDEFAGPDCRCVICATERFLFRKLTNRKESHDSIH